MDDRPRLRAALLWSGRGLTLLSWLVAAALLILQVLRWTGVTDDRPSLIAVSTMWPLVVLPGVLVVLVAVARRLRALRIAAALVAAVVIAAWWPAWTGRVGPGAPGGMALRVLSLNVEFSQDDGAAVSRQVAEQNPDIVVLTELSRTTLRHLDLAQYPYSWTRPQPGAFGQGVWSRWPLQLDELISVPTTAAYGTVSMPLLTIRTPQGPLRLVQVHPPAPTDGASIRTWKDVLRQVDRRLSQGSGPVVAAGDFNASRWVGVFGDLLGGPHGIREASRGRGFLPTWPQGRFRLVGPFFPLDHVLVSRDIGVRGFRVLGPVGSDHRGVVADLNVAPR